MCGITGAIDSQPDRGRRRVEVLNERQSHRGPDHSAIASLGAFTIGNTRLAIQDPTPAGNQPFRSSDGRYVCVFNGEIYNYLELIEEFGLRPANRCDGAVIPELWAKLGPSALRRFRGMFAAAIVDTVGQTLTLCRDPFGIKPLYLRHMPDGSVLFASEVRPLTAIDAPPPLSHNAVAQYLHLGALPADVSPFETVTAVPPNTIINVDRRGHCTESAIVLGPRPYTQGVEGEEEVRSPGKVLRESVRLHLRSDVPVVLLLSAGLDSAAIAAAARQEGYDLHSITVAGVDGSDESGPAAATAAHYRHTHQVTPASVDVDSIHEYFAAMQRPSIDGLNTFIVCRAVKASGYRVALSGLGGDEALGGYSHFRLLPVLPVLRIADHIPWLSRLVLGAARVVSRSLLSEKARRLVQPGGPRAAIDLGVLQRELFSPGEVLDMTGVEIDLSRGESPHSALNVESLVDAEVATYMQATLLPDADTFSMCSSVELRVPFVDKAFFASATAANEGRKKALGKRLLAESLDDAFLREICRRPKAGFTLPMNTWMEDGSLRWVVDCMQDSNAPIWDYVRRPEVLGRLAKSRPGRWSERWAFASLNQWLLSLSRPVTLRDA